MKPKPRATGRAVNWDEVRRRMDRAAEATEGALRLSPERSRAVLDERARLLARVPAAAARASEVLEIAAFTLANEDYGVETRYVREVVRLTEYAPVPGSPAFLTGIMNLRGEILALIDLRTFFGLPARGLTDTARVLILGNEHAEFGVLADAALEVTTLRIEELHEPPESAAGVDREYLRGVTKDALIVLDGAALLRDGRLFVDQGEETGG
jgi:purine-binding chemotaxis protein CheW